MSKQEELTIGVEEEYQIIAPATRESRSRAALVLSLCAPSPPAN